MIVNIKNHASFDKNNDCHLLAVENILNGFREGKHIILAPRVFFSELSRCEKFSMMTRHTSAEASRTQTEYQSLMGHVSFHVDLDFSLNNQVYGWSCIADQDVLSVSPYYFKDSKSVQKVGVICENPNDADFYNVMGAYYGRKINGRAWGPLNFDAINGGGGTIKDVFERKVNDMDIILCILDNDKKHPNYPKGGTCKLFKGNKNIKTGMVKIIDAHEVESLIPLETIREVVSKNGTNKRQEKALSFWEEIVGYDESVKFYFDHKKGIDFPTALSIDKEYGEYWVPLLRKSSYSRESACIQQDRCDCNPPCLKIDGYGDGILTQTISHIKYGNTRTYTPQLTEQMMSLWSDIGKLFFSWCCGPIKKTRA